MRHCRRDPEGQAAVRSIRRTSEATCAGTQRYAVFIDHQDLRIFLREPRRRSCGWSAQNDGDLMCVKNANGTLEPFEVEAAFPRLHQRPGKLGDAHIRDACGCHGHRVLFPQALGSLVGVVVGPQQEGQTTGRIRGNVFLLGPQKRYRVLQGQQRG